MLRVMVRTLEPLTMKTLTPSLSLWERPVLSEVEGARVRESS
jgi:hypothetical protein